MRLREGGRETRRALYRSLDTRRDRLETERRPFSWSLPHHRDNWKETRLRCSSMTVLGAVSVLIWKTDYSLPERNQKGSNNNGSNPKSSAVSTTKYRKRSLCNRFQTLAGKNSTGQTQRYNQTVPSQPWESGCQQRLGKSPTTSSEKQRFPYLCV